MKPIRLLHVIAGMDPKMGGVSQAVRTMIAGLSNLGIHNEVVSLDAIKAPFIKGNPFPIHAQGAGKGPWCYSPGLIPWLTDNFSRFDALIVHGLWLYHGYAVQKAMRIFKSQQKKGLPPKFYIMPHGMLDPYFQLASGRKLKALRNWAYWKLIEGKVVNGADGLLFTCEEECRLAREPFNPYHPKCEIVVGLGVETPPHYIPAMQEAFLKQCPELRNRPYLLFLSRIHEKKGVDDLIKAYTTVFSKTPETKRPKLVIAGPGLETSYGQRMQQLVSETETANTSVFFPGMLTGDAKWGAFYGCEAFVLPSHQENFGIAVVEALACGKPVLISNQVNIWREIESSGGGMVADDTMQGVQGLLDSWQCLLNEEKLAMGRRARQSFEKDFAMGPAANRLLNVLAS